jgi:hypothetical protein
MAYSHTENNTLPEALPVDLEENLVNQCNLWKPIKKQNKFIQSLQWNFQSFHILHLSNLLYSFKADDVDILYYTQPKINSLPYLSQLRHMPILGTYIAKFFHDFSHLNGIAVYLLLTCESCNKTFLSTLHQITLMHILHKIRVSLSNKLNSFTLKFSFLMYGSFPIINHIS